MENPTPLPKLTQSAGYEVGSEEVDIPSDVVPTCGKERDMPPIARRRCD